MPEGPITPPIDPGAWGEDETVDQDMEAIEAEAEALMRPRSVEP